MVNLKNTGKCPKCGEIIGIVLHRMVTFDPVTKKRGEPFCKPQYRCEKCNKFYEIEEIEK